MLKKIVSCLLTCAFLSASALECEGGAADFSRSQLSHIWQQEFALPSGKRPPVETKIPISGYSADQHLRPNQPHPAVVRVIVPENGATSYGSGTLIDLRGQFGLVITNWHVVRDAQGMVDVVFPGGFKSKARALKVDPDWDLAALVIWRPPVEPVSIAPIAPQPGDQLTICGYGQGMYRSATGNCTQYYAPRLDFPQHMVELDVEARQGDSGGPIFNRKGELAGVLFGAGQGTTLGSFGGRVESFLASLAPDIGQKAGELSLASNSSPNRRERNRCQQMCRQDGFCSPCEKLEPVDQPLRSVSAEPAATQVDDGGWHSPRQNLNSLAAMWPEESVASEREKPPGNTQPAATEVARRKKSSLNESFDQMKNILAAIGLVSIAVLILRAAR